ncbi:glutathione S-transferase family protein [Gymnodinialimonas sp. 2305UL16-5]|uniref:glutathione S-transferase family protein n=1 Tax=Gymnodinialimonas mytili TaxID=3126503 RepID=UPI00309EC501
MTELILTTLDWVPEFPRGFVRDLRIRWALEEADIPYQIATTPVGDAEARLPFQPFGQVPWLTDGDITIFESGAILLYLGEGSTALMPADRPGRAKVMEWLFAALNSVEMPAVPWSLYRWADDETQSPARAHLERFLDGRLNHMEAVLAKGDWLTGPFSIADIAMSDVLRQLRSYDVFAKRPACQHYVERATARPAFKKAYADQIAHFEAADVERTARSE